MFNLNKTTAYKNLLRDNDRIDHHNYVIKRAVSETTRHYGKTFDELDDSEREQFDLKMFQNLVSLDHNPRGCDQGCGIIEVLEIPEDADFVDVYGQGSNIPTKKGVEGYEVQFKVLAYHKENDDFKYKSFLVVLQSHDRLDNIRAYNGYEMCFANSYGSDWDESLELSTFLEDAATSEEDTKYFMVYLEKEASRYCKTWLLEHTDEDL